MKRPSLEHLVVGVLGLALFILLVVSIVSYKNISALTVASELQVRTYRNLTALDGVPAGLKDVEAGVQGYLSTGRESSLAPYRAAVQATRDRLKGLKQFFAGEPAQKDLLKRLESQVARKLRFASQVVKTRKDQGRLPAVKLNLSGRGEQLMDDVQKTIVSMEAEETRVQGDRERIVHRSTRHAMTAIVVCSLLAIAIVGLASVILLRELAERVRNEKTLGEVEERFRLLVDGVKDYAVISLDPDGRVTSWNAGAERITGYGAKEIIGKDFTFFYPGEDIELGRPQQALKTAEDEGRCEEECWHVNKNGVRYWANSVITVLRDGQGKVRGYSKVTQDISDRRRSEESMKKLSQSVEQATDLVVMTDLEGKIEFINKAVEDITGYTRSELIGKNRSIWRSGETDEKLLAEMRDALLAGRPFQAIFANRKKDGELFYVYEAITPLKEPGGAVTHFVSTGKDITQQRVMEERLNYLAYFDALTGVPNRMLFIDRLTQGIARSRYGKKIIAVLISDIDRFKLINDGYGLPVGDRVLKAVTEQLAASIREGDTLARLGSDDFGVILFDVAATDDIVLVIKKITENTSRPVKVRGEDVVLTVALGIAVYPYDGETADDLMKHADIALSKAKQQGRNNYQFYTKDMNLKAMEFVSIDKRLFNSYKNREFMLYYQPYWDTETQKITGMEALIRWNSTDQGIISPDKFIPVLEDTGMIIEVGDWIVKSVCQQIRDWHDRGFAPVPVAVNISSIQFRKKDLAETIMAAIEQARIDPKLLTLEITESTFMQNVEFATAVFKKLKETGISISIDDFGTGYSSLSYLKKFPFDNLKIDISFIRDLTLDSDASTIVSAIIAMARSLNLKTIAEGVETDDLWKILKLLKCDMVQGNLFCPALPPKGVEIYFE